MAYDRLLALSRDLRLASRDRQQAHRCDGDVHGSELEIGSCISRGFLSLGPCCEYSPTDTDSPAPSCLGFFGDDLGPVCTETCTCNLIQTPAIRQAQLRAGKLNEYLTAFGICSVISVANTTTSIKLGDAEMTVINWRAGGGEPSLHLRSA